MKIGLCAGSDVLGLTNFCSPYKLSSVAPQYPAQTTNLSTFLFQSI